MPAKSSIGTSAVQLTATPTPVVTSILVKAAEANTGIVYIGYANTVTANSADATDGIPLHAGQSISIPAFKLVTKNVTDIWVIGSAASQKAFFDTDISETVSSGNLSATSITVDSELSAAAALTDNFANPTSPAVGSFGMLWDGAAWDRAPGTSTDGTLVNLGTNNDVTVTGSTSDGGPSWTSVFGISGARFTSADASGAVASVSDAPTSGQKVVVTDILVSVDTATRVDFKCETSGVVVASIYLPASGVAQITPRSKFKLATADKKLQIQTSAAGNIAVTAFYYSEA